MTQKMQTGIEFKIENCHARHRVADLVDCLTAQQAPICGFSLAFGNSFFCKHPRRNAFIEATKMIPNQPVFERDDVSLSNDQ
ncbi:MAG: hypothetical protein AB1649_23220 [Chloroflexota bacterium]